MCNFSNLLFIEGNKNVEALNIRTAEEIKVLKRNLESLKQDTSLEQAEKAAKNGKNREEYYESAKEMQRANGYMDQRATGR